VAGAQCLTSVLAGWLLWQLWRSTARKGTLVGWIVGGGLVIRAIAASTLFWISYLELPVARSLQAGDGYWTLALDSKLYVSYVQWMINGGWSAILFPPPGAPSPVYLQVFAAFSVLFGLTVATGALINLFAYLGTCWLMTRHPAGEKPSKTMLFVLAAYSFSPGVLLWAVQPLKDSIFLLLIAAFVYLATRLQEFWAASSRPIRIVTVLASMTALLYAITGIRWYFGLLILLGMLPFLLLVSGTARRPLTALATCIVTVVVMSQVVVSASGTYLPDRVARVLRPTSHSEMAIRSLPGDVGGMMGRTRRGFERSGGASAIRVGSSLRNEPQVEPVASKPEAPTVSSPGRSAETARKASENDKVTALAGETVPHGPASEESTAATEPTLAAEGKSAGPHSTNTADAEAGAETTSMPDRPASPHSEQAGAVTPPSPKPLPATTDATRPAETAASEATVPTTTTETQPDAGNDSGGAMRTDRSGSDTASSHKTAPTSNPRLEANSDQQERAGQPTQPDATRKAESAGAPTLNETPGAVDSTPAATSLSGEQPVTAQPVAAQPVPAPMPSTTQQRLTTGLAALLLPRFVSHALGIVEIGGGQGLWLLTETDTLLFDAVLIVAVLSLFRALRSRPARRAGVWLSALVTFGILGALSYTVTNYGTLFRHRSMVFIGLCMIAILATRRSDPAIPETSDGAPSESAPGPPLEARPQTNER
jgi:hypothetical protein